MTCTPSDDDKDHSDDDGDNDGLPPYADNNNLNGNDPHPWHQ